MNLHEMLDVMRAFADGKKIQVISPGNPWRDEPNPTWNWSANDYRIAPTPKTWWAVLTPCTKSTVGSLHDSKESAQCKAGDDFQIIQVIEKFEG